MYKNIKSIEIFKDNIRFEIDDDKNTKGNIFSKVPFDFNVKHFETRFEYKTDYTTIVILRSFMTVFLNDKPILKFYIPRPVRYYIEKDIKLKGSFSLEYRKHLRSEYDNTRHVLANLNGVDTESDAFAKIKKKVEKYSRGIHNQPILSVFYDCNEDVIRYSIISDNIVVESGYEPITEKTDKQQVSNLPNIFDLKDDLHD